MREAAASVASNIAEGFGRRTHRDFLRFLDMARGSLNETRDRAIDAADRGCLRPTDLDEITTLAHRTGAALARLMAYLREHPQ